MPFHKPKWLSKIRNFIKKIKHSLTRTAKGAVKDDVPKRPPPAATPLQFPRVDLGSSQYPSKATFDELCKTVVSFPREGPTTDHLKSFNIHVTEDIQLEDLIPTTHLPPPSWLEEPEATAASYTFPAPSSPPPATLLSNRAPAPDQVSFYLRLNELLYQNDDAFDFLRRKQLPPGKQIRIAHFRKFWDKLYMMAEYWDASKDNYKPASPKAVEEQTYTGRRVSCGAKMPNDHREATANAFVETIAWNFKCRVELPSIEPKLSMQTMRIPVPQTGVVYRTPADQAKARRGVLEGPLVGITCRMGVEFRKAGEQEGSGRAECLDLVREIGSALMMAQKRRREGMVKTKDWEGKWWAEKRRWGGGKGGEVGSLETGASSTAATSKDRKNVEQWKKLKPPSSGWDRGVEYMQIGKQKDAEYDDIYLISSLNHHISILRVRIPNAYIDFITNGPPSSSSNKTNSKDFIPSQHPWFKLDVQRSKWYDLLNPEDRAQAMRGVWGVLGWMMRETGGDAEEKGKEKEGKGEGKEDVEMTDKE